MSNYLDWTGTLPDGWQLKPLRAIADSIISNVDKFASDDEIPVRLCNYTDVYKNEFIRPDLDLMHATASAQEIERFRLQADDVVITKDSESWEDIGVPALVAETADDVVCGYHLALLRPHKEAVHGAFLFRRLQARPIQVQLELAASGVTRFGLSKFDIRRTVVPVPPLRQQRAIADYLDRETARLDPLVAAKERLLALLAEKRRAVVTRAVTRGLDPRVPTRDSGVPWLGAVPAHWELTRLKFVADVRGGLAIGKNYRVPHVEEYPYVSVANVQDGYLSLDEVKTIRIPPEEAENYLLRTGDVLMNEGGDDDKLGRGCIWNGAIDPCLHQNHVFAVRPRRVEPEWIDVWASSGAARCHFQNYAKKTTNLASISTANIQELPLLVPPAEERREIADHSTESLQRLAAVQSAIASTAVLVKERRVAIANRLIAHNERRAPGKGVLTSVAETACDGGGGVRHRVFATPEVEAAFVPRDIRDRRLDAAHCVVLGRTSKLLARAAEALNGAGVAAYLMRRKTDFESAAVRVLVEALRLANARHDRDVLRRLCLAWKGLSGDALEPEAVVAASALSGGDFLRAWADSAAARAAGPSADALERLRTDLVDALAFPSIVDWFLEDGWKAWSGADGNEDQELAGELEVWRALHHDVVHERGENVTLNVYLQQIDLASKAPLPKPGAVRCMTVHGSKGLEFRHVYLIGMAQEVFPSFQALRRGVRSRELEEERRNCFVAITRAERTLTLTRAERYHGYPKPPSQFLAEMGIGTGNGR